MVLTIEYLKTFLIAADSGSFTRAAAAVYRTQSAVSMQMKRLEEEIGQPIFVRNGKNLALTTTLKFDIAEATIYRLIVEEGACRIEQGEGNAIATMYLTSKDALKLFAGELDPVVAFTTGKIRVQGDARAFLVLQDVL